MLDDGARLFAILDHDGILIRALDFQGRVDHVVFGARPRLASAILAGLAPPEGDGEASGLRILADTLARFERAGDVRAAFEDAARVVTVNWTTEVRREVLDRPQGWAARWLDRLRALGAPVAIMVALVAVVLVAARFFAPAALSPPVERTPISVAPSK